MIIFLQAVVLMLVIEGIGWLIFPGQLSRWMLELIMNGEAAIRRMALGSLFAAFLLYCLIPFSLDRSPQCKQMMPPVIFRNPVLVKPESRISFSSFCAVGNSLTVRARYS